MSEFMHVQTKEKVRIVSESDNHYVLNSGMKIDKTFFHQQYAISPTATLNADDFMNTKTNIQMNPRKQENIINENIINTNSTPIDPIDFLNSPSMNSIQGLDSLKNLDTSKFVEPHETQRTVIRNLASESSAIQTSTHTLEEEKRMLLERHNKLMASNNNAPGYVDENDESALNNMMTNMSKPAVKKPYLNENGLTEAQEMVRQNQMALDGTDPFAEKIKKFRESNGLKTESVSNPKPITEVMINNTPSTIISEQHIQQPIQVVEDPTTALFKKFKRNHNISISLKIKDKISKPDFIKVMADGLEGDIIQFYTDQIFSNYFSNIDNIKQDIYNQIHLNVYGCLPNENEDDEKEEEVIIPKKRVSKTPKEDVIVLIAGKPTKDGSRTYKYVNEKGKTVDLTPNVAEEKGFKPYTK